jgi:ketosteroid isomerase-like protein
VSSASGSDGAVFVTYTTARRGDRTLDVNEVLMLHVRDGRIVERYQVPFDQQAWDAFWAD